MKISKKFIAGISAFIVAVSSVAITVSAVNTDDVTGDLTVSVVPTTNSVSAGDTLTVNLVISNLPDTGIAGFEFAVKYDANALSFVSLTETDGVSDTANSKELELVEELKDTMVNDGADYSCFDYYVNEDSGKIACMWATGLENSEYWLSESGTIATIVFTVNENIDVDSVSIGIDSILDDGSVIFAIVDDNGNYSAYDSVAIGDDATIEISSEGTTTGGGGSTTLYGDVNVDGSVNGVDLILLKQYVLGLDPDISEEGLINADVDANELINGLDLVQMKQYVLGLIDQLGPTE